MKAPDPIKTRNRQPHLVGLVSDAPELKQRIATSLAAVGLEIELLAPPPLDDPQQTPGAVVATVSGNPTRTAAAIKAIRRRVPDVPLVVVVPSSKSRPEGRAAISAGADGAVFVSDIENALAATLTAAAGGQVAFPDGLLQAPKRPSLTRREKQALGMMVLGFTNQEIGNRLGLAESTIKSHLSSAFEKLGVSSRTQATALLLDTANGVGLDALAIDQDAKPAERA